MTDLVPLPETAFTRPWRVGSLGEAGRAARRDPAFTSPHHGVRVSTLVDAAAPRTRALAAAAAVRETVLAGWAAAHLLGALDLDGAAPDGSPLPVPVAPGTSGRCGRRPGIVPWRSALAPGDVVEADGVVVTSPVRTAFDLARTAPDLRWAVADVDALLRAGVGLDRTDLALYAADRPGWRGVAQARDAAALADPGSRSRPESWMRVVWVVDAQLPPPLLNARVHSGAGHLLGLPDLLDPGSGLAGEYDGRHHLSATQLRADAVRAEQMASAGLVLVRTGAGDLAHPRLLAHRLRLGQHRALRGPPGTWWVPSGR